MAPIFQVSTINKKYHLLSTYCMPNTMLISLLIFTINSIKEGTVIAPFSGCKNEAQRAQSTCSRLSQSPEFKLISVCLCSAISQALPCPAFPTLCLSLYFPTTAFGGGLWSQIRQKDHILQINEVQRGEVTHSRSHRK